MLGSGNHAPKDKTLNGTLWERNVKRTGGKEAALKQVWKTLSEHPPICDSRSKKRNHLCFGRGRTPGDEKKCVKEGGGNKGLNFFRKITPRRISFEKHVRRSRTVLGRIGRRRPTDDVGEGTARQGEFINRVWMGEQFCNPSKSSVEEPEGKTPRPGQRKKNENSI